MASSSHHSESDSGSTVTEADLQTLRTAAQKKPLAHPLLSSVRLHDYEYAPPEHLREMYGAVFRGLSPAPEYANAPKNILRLYPREHGKSEAVSHVIPTWAALRDPNIRILIMSESQKQANNKLDLIRESINRYGPIFDRAIKTDAARELTLEREANWDVATVTAAGFETSITGGHFDLIIFDDLVDYKSQRTETRRETVEREFQNYLNLGSEGETVYVVIGTRKHPADLYSRLINSRTWDTQVKAAISDFSVVENSEYRVITPDGMRYDSLAEVPAGETVTGVEPTREVETLWPERWPLEKLIYEYLTASTEGEGSAIWRRENMNDPMALMGNILTEDMLVWDKRLPKADDRMRWYAGLDIAIVEDAEEAATGDTDYWAVAVIAQNPETEKTWLVDIARRRGMTMRQGLQWVKTMTEPYADDLARLLVEKNQAQRWLVQEAKDMDFRVTGSTSTGDKHERILAMSSRFESGKVRIAEERTSDERWEAFKQEWVQYTGDDEGHHDDMLDAVEIALRNLSMENIQRSSKKISDIPGL